MRTNNRFYIGGPPLDPPEYLVMIRCTYCAKSSYSAEWIKNEGDCPRCNKPYAGPENED